MATKEFKESLENITKIEDEQDRNKSFIEYIKNHKNELDDNKNYKFAKNIAKKYMNSETCVLFIKLYGN